MDLRPNSQHGAHQLAVTRADAEAPLLNLAHELLDDIVKYLPPQDLLQARQACKTLNKMSSLYFAKAFFDNQTFLLSDSMAIRTLREISKREDFARHIETVRFESFGLIDEFVYGIRPYWHPKSWAESSEMPELRWPSDRKKEIADMNVFGFDHQTRPLACVLC